MNWRSTELIADISTGLGLQELKGKLENQHRVMLESFINFYLLWKKRCEFKSLTWRDSFVFKARFVGATFGSDLCTRKGFRACWDDYRFRLQARSSVFSRDEQPLLVDDFGWRLLSCFRQLWCKLLRRIHKIFILAAQNFSRINSLCAVLKSAKFHTNSPMKNPSFRSLSKASKCFENCWDWNSSDQT